MRFSNAITFVIRYLLVMLFFPFSAIDKILNFDGAVSQAKEVVPADKPAKALIATGLCLELLGPLAILTGKRDRLAAFLMAGYCATTALLWKRFWEPGDFWHEGQSRGRDLFWDFLKNFSVAGGFLLIAFGTRADEDRGFLADPLSSTKPYARKVNRR